MSNQSFLADVNEMFDVAASRCDLPEGLAEKIKVCNATYVTERIKDRLMVFSLSRHEFLLPGPSHYPGGWMEDRPPDR